MQNLIGETIEQIRFASLRKRLSVNLFDFVSCFIVNFGVDVIANFCRIE